MFDSSPGSQKISLTCRFIQHDQWLTTHIEPSWTIRQLKLWLIHRLFAIPVPQRFFSPPSSSGKAPERPPSPITFAPDPRTRPASPIIFAPPQKGGFYGSATERGWLSDTDEELLSGDDNGTSSSAVLAKRKSRMMTINVGPGGSHSDSDSPPHIPPAQHPRSPTSSTTAAATPPSASTTNPDVERFPGGINPSHWTLIRYSTGQILPDDDLISWNDIHEFELVELHGPSLPSTHILYEYLVCHVWNPERHHQRERLKGKLKKRFESEMANSNKNTSSKDKNKERDKADASRAAYHTQVLKAMSLDSNTGTNLGVVEYYGQRLAKTKIAPSLTRIPRSIDVYVQPYWEGWVRTLRIVYRGNPHEVAFLAAMGGGIGSTSGLVGGGGAGGSNSGAGQGMQDSYRFGTGPVPNGFGVGPQLGYFNPGEKNPHLHHNPSSGGSTKGSYPGNSKVVRVEWRERWVKIQNGYLIVLREPNNEDATHVLPLKNIISLMDTHHLVRYLSYSGFNPPLDHPSVNQDILTPALNLPISRPPRPSHGYFDESSSDESTYNRHHRKGLHSSHGSSTHHGQGHHSSGSWPGGGVGGVIVGGGVGGSEKGGKEYNFDFRDASYLRQHMKARELTPLVGSRFDPTYLPITNEEQKASGLRVVCLQFRKPTAPSTPTTTTRPVGGGGGGFSFSNHNRKKSKLEQEEEREKRKERERAKENEADPSTLALEDMRERAGEWGGLRSNNPFWKCPPRLRREPTYIHRFKTRMRMRYGRNAVITSSTTAPGAGSRGRGAGNKSRESSSGKGANQDFLSVGRPHHRHHHHRRHHHRQQPYRKERAYNEKDRRPQEKEGMLTAQFLGGGIPTEEKERKAEKARMKREKQEEKERLKHEKEVRGSGSGGKEKDWKLGALNVDFWNWGKKKKKAKQEKEMKMRLEEHERQIEEHFAAASASAHKVPQAAAQSITTIEASTISTLPSTTAIGSGSGIRSVGPSSDEDGVESVHWDRGRSETSNIETTEEEEEDEDASEEDDEEKEVKDDDDDDGVPEPYPDAFPPESSSVRGDDEDEEIEYADRPPAADSPDPFASSISTPETPSPGGSGESILPAGPSSLSVVVQVEVDKRVETETETEDGNRRRSRTITTPYKGKEPRRLSSPNTITEEQSLQHALFERQQSSHRLVGQLHTSDDEHNEIGGAEQEEDESDLSSPVFAPPPSMRRVPITSRHNDHAGSVSSHRSSTSFDASLEGSTTGDETDEDLTFDNEFPDFKRSGYRYGLYSNRREGEKKRYRREREEKEAKMREQRILEEREVLLEKERIERDRERRERRRKEEEGEWVCLDLGNDFAFGSFLRIVHQHCLHPIKSNFLERMLGGLLNDHPPPSQSSAKKNPPTSLRTIVESKDTPEPPIRQETTPSRDPTEPPMPPSTPSIATSSSRTIPPISDDSETEYVVPLPGYGDPRFQYPSRTSGTLPYPEWRINILRKAQRAGTGDVGRAMGMLYWGREDPVIAGASGVVHEFERMAMRREGDGGEIPGFQSYGGGGGGGKGKEKRRESGSGTEDNVSSLGTIGPMTIGSSGTVNALSPTQQRRMSIGGRSIQSATSPKETIPEIPQEGGDSGTERSGEDSDRVVTSTSSASGGDGGGGDGEHRKHKESTKRISLGTPLVNWSDDEDNTSELEWVGWQMDVQRQAKRQYAIQARRGVESKWESDAELADLGLPVNPTDDMRRYIKNRYQLEPEASIILGERPEATDTQTTLLSASTNQISSTSASLTTSSPLARMTATDTHERTPSQNSHTLHHSASLHTGLKKDSSPLRRPSMPILNVNVLHENRVDRGKTKARSFRDITSLGSSNDESKSPTMPSPPHGRFTSFGSSSKDREGMSPRGASAGPAGSTSGSMGRSGNILLGRSKMKKKDCSEQERERGMGSEGDKETRQGQQRPQLRVATSLSVGSPSSSAVVESIKSPTFGINRRLGRMQSDASILSNSEASPPPHTKKRGVIGKLRELADSSIDFVEGN